MAIGTIHKLDKVVLPASVIFDVIRSQRWVAGIQSLLEHPAGHYAPMFRANQVQKPSLEFTTSQLDVLLPAIGVGGAAVGSTTTYFKLASTTGNAARPSLVHQKVVLPQTCGYWTSIRLTHNGVGEANVVLVSIWDGTNDPFVYTGSQALAGTFASSGYSFYGAGPAAINGVQLPGIQEITIDSGIRLIQVGDTSEEFDTFVGIEKVEPTITIRTLETVDWSTIGLRGTVLDGTNGVACYARKWSANGSRVANITAQHISFTGLLGTAIPIDSNGQNTGPVSDTIRCELISSTDSVYPLTHAVNVAIPLAG